MQSREEITKLIKDKCEGKCDIESTAIIQLEVLLDIREQLIE